MAKKATKKNSKASASARAEIGELIRVEGVKLPGTKETTTVSFKEMTEGRFRAKPHGHPAVFVNLTERGATAYIRGGKYHEERSPQRAFAAALGDAAKKKSPATVTRERAGRDGGRTR